MAQDVMVLGPYHLERQDWVVFQGAELLRPEVDLIFFDTTSSCLESQGGGEDGLRRFVYIRDGRTECRWQSGWR